MKNFEFKINKKITPIRTGENKFKFAIDNSGITNINITQDKIEDVIYSIFDDSEYMDVVKVITNVKGKQKIPKIFLQGAQYSGNGLIPSAGCGFVDTTDLVLNDVDIEVEKLRMGMELCLDDLVNYSFEVHITDGARNEDLDISDALLAYFTQVLRANIQDYLFNDSTNGIIPKLHTSASDATVTATSALGKLLDIYNSLPESWQNSTRANPIIFISPNLFTSIRGEIFSSTAPITSSIEIINNRFKLPLTNASVITLPFLTGTKAYAGISNYLFAGTDLESDFEDTRVWYSNDNETIRFSSQVYLGTAVAAVESFVKYEP
ncbi:MAG TPA: hypothetical protein PKY44_07435 [Bacteroidales bacterium]|nr:hypothetical protein [Bacteroidales bacterium]